MRRIIIFLVSLAICCGVGFATYAAYINHEEPIELDDMSSKDRIMYPDGTFEAKFRCEIETLKISSVEYTVEGDILYISLYGAPAAEPISQPDEEGYITLRIENLPEISTVYYVCDDKQRELTFEYDTEDENEEIL